MGILIRMDNLRKPNFPKWFSVCFSHPLVLGLMVTIWQVGFALSAGSGTLQQRYQSLTQWDGGWYRLIILEGYHAPPIEEWNEDNFGTVGFFPGYPLTAQLFYHLGLPVRVALPFTAQLFAWLMWSFWFVLLKRWQLSPLVIFFATLLIVSHPMAFFLVASYSESMCLAGFLGFWIGSQLQTRWGIWMAIVHGIALTSSRIVGTPVALLPLIQKVLPKSNDFMTWKRAILLSFGALLGVGTFFLFCQIRFGHWDMYQKTQGTFWNVHPDYTVVLTPTLYLPTLRHQPAERFFHADYWTSLRYDDLGYFQTALGFWFFPAIAIFELIGIYRGGTGWRQRWPFWYAAAVFFYLAAVAHYSRLFGSVTRHYYVALIPITLAVCHALSEYRLSRKAVVLVIVVLSLLALGLLIAQYKTQAAYMQGLWIA